MDNQIITRKHSPMIKVCCLPKEKVAIETNAANCALSASAYLRNLGMHYQPKSVLDYRAVMELSKVNADQGRLGGLLKMWLSNDESFRLDHAYNPNDIYRLLHDIIAHQKLLLETAKRV